MRNRNIIETIANKINIHENENALQLEVLLDIRDLLKEAKNK